MTFLISLLGHNPSLHLYKYPTNMYNLIYKIVIKHKILVRCNTHGTLPVTAVTKLLGWR